MNWILKAAAFFAFVGVFAFIFFKVGDLWLKASMDALEADAAIGRQAGEADPQARSSDAQSAAGAEPPLAGNAAGEPAVRPPSRPLK